MTKPFKVVNNIYEVPLDSKEWQDASKFARNKIKSHKGREYRIISKKEKDFSLIERILRGTLGTFAVIGTLGFGFLNKDFDKSITKLFTKEKKSLRYAVLQKNTEELAKDLRGTELNTEQDLIRRLALDYNGLGGHIKIENNIIEMPPVPGATGRTIDATFLPKALEEMYPEEIKSYLGNDFSLIAPTLALILQQGVTAEFGLRAHELINDPIPGTMFECINRYPYFEFSKVNDEIFLLVKTRGFLTCSIDRVHQRDYYVSQRINLTNPKAKVEMNLHRIYPLKSTNNLLEELKVGLETDEKLIQCFQIDYSTMKDHIKLDNKVVDMGDPAFAEKRGTGINPPDTLEEMFPEEIKAYFGDAFPSIAPTLTLLLQQGIGLKLTEEASKLIDDPIPNTSLTLNNVYPYFEISKYEEEIFLAVKVTARLIDLDNGENKRNYSIDLEVNLTKPDTPAEMILTKD